MLEIIPLTPNMNVAAQITAEDMDDIACAGIQTIINNRPDFEVPGQPTHAEIAAAAARHNIHVESIPVSSGAFDPASIEAMRERLEACAGPFLAYCRSGTRSTMLWGLSQAGLMSADEIINCAGKAGYDLTMLRGMLDVSSP